MNIGSWYEQKFSDSTLYFLPVAAQKNGGWSGILVEVDHTRRARPRAKKSSARSGPYGSAAHWSVLWRAASSVPANVEEEALARFPGISVARRDPHRRSKTMTMRRTRRMTMRRIRRARRDPHTKPANWSSMTRDERRAWNRAAYAAARPAGSARPAAAPQQAAAPSSGAPMYRFTLEHFEGPGYYGESYFGGSVNAPNRAAAIAKLDARTQEGIAKRRTKLHQKEEVRDLNLRLGQKVRVAKYGTFKIAHVGKNGNKHHLQAVSSTSKHRHIYFFPDELARYVARGEAQILG